MKPQPELNLSDNPPANDTSQLSSLEYERTYELLRREPERKDYRTEGSLIYFWLQVPSPTSDRDYLKA
jgi:hypothetical protein